MNRLILLIVVGALVWVPAPAMAQSYGALEFPADEHMKLDGLDYWWGAADIVTTVGNHYTVSMAYTGFSAYAVSGHQLWAHQGPWEGLSILTEVGPTEWGHEATHTDGYLTTLSTYVPGVSELLRLETRSLHDGGAVIDSFERLTLDEPRYRLVIDNDAADVHPTDRRVRLGVDLEMVTHDGPPLLAGGTGTWWYGIPATYGYPSRSFQYMQASRQVSGTIELEQPDGTITTETVDPSRSNWVMIHEYDASPEDIPTGLALAQATQMHPRYAQYYQGGMPWEIIFFDLDNGAQVMLVVMAFHFTEEGTLHEVIGPDQPTYRILATLRLPSGESIALDDDLHVEHLNYREIIGRVPTAFVATWGHWLQGWETRIGHPGGEFTVGDGSTVTVPPFDLGLSPWLDSRQPAIDTDGNGLTQRAPFGVAGHWDGCPIRGSGWSELIINWHGRTHKDPWYTGGSLPPVPNECGDPTVGVVADTGLPLTPTPDQQGEIVLEVEGCQAFNPGQPTCSYTATVDGGISGMSSEPGGWTITIARPGRAEPIVVNGYAGMSVYACGIIQPGDVVDVEVTAPNSGATVGNPGLCTTGNVFEDDDVILLPGPTTDQVQVSGGDVLVTSTTGGPAGGSSGAPTPATGSGLAAAFVVALVALARRRAG